MGNSVFLIAVERSGENLGLDILRRTQAAGLGLHWYGVVGARLQAAGVRSVADGEVLGVMGFVEVLRHYAALRRLYARIEAVLRQERPQAVVLIDHPAFNLRVARLAKSLGIAVLYVVGPQIWAWRAGRIAKMRERIDRMLVLFPFERPLYAEAGIPVQVLPHPLLAQCQAAPSREAARAALGIAADVPLLALLPGSRPTELRRLARGMVETAQCLRERLPQLEVAVALAREDLLPLWQSALGEERGIRLVLAQSLLLLAAADVVLVASGTATLETALMRRPAVVVYAMQPVTFWLARRLVRVPFVAMPNILLQQKIYPEYLQDAFQPKIVAEALERLLGPAGRAQCAALEALPEKLRGDDDAAIAAALEAVLGGGRA
ncbi:MULTISPECIES: lipid-A-disaccharide synthase [Acidithiobacillus]|jgi:lipid-A-disaccharide synthase|uniref:Lipid-A-disaccharide synthase n=3 Tax=Acidithiobacillus caldus TaxID=33059 RepID=F9ZM23_ACICS|nr:MULTISPECIES: lipid-A-disaccharide synthase [Acidithiobacillus]AEK57505.1 Lipid-A-disaccharide synthase [Acidithiobacillus caldus SM-1]AIA54716.1 Lipid-A-disaccharide synthase [Acidithiobacillus caldus ATCC 51756]AUW32214.1 lipid-A-disaccharide synthase [Acidithiobacillus caldus]MBU2731062.1 lipid-A-disaccharide synthase [Acidithiobacillus caldus]MBU2735045.1 lipid-A-disaccharide synthase [Acidithiobacillus caldus ATCC 51756]